MIHKQTMKTFFCGALVVAGMFASIENADAAQKRLRFDPAYGAPFGSLGWNGEAIVDYGNCDGPGNVYNVGACSGQLSFVSATVNLYNSGTDAPLQTINFLGGQVAKLTFASVDDLTSVWSSPFNAVQGDGDAESKYMGSSAWFSLIFVGEYAQLMWFNKDPGNALLDPLEFPYAQLPSAAIYLGCYFAGQGNENAFFKGCGISSNPDGTKGAVLKITPVPEPETYALMLAGLGALAFVASRRRSTPR